MISLELIFRCLHIANRKTSCNTKQVVSVKIDNVFVLGRDEEEDLYAY